MSVNHLLWFVLIHVPTVRISNTLKEECCIHTDTFTIWTFCLKRTELSSFSSNQKPSRFWTKNPLISSISTVEIKNSKYILLYLCIYDRMVGFVCWFWLVICVFCEPLCLLFNVLECSWVDSYCLIGFWVEYACFWVEIGLLGSVEQLDSFYT